MCCLLQILGGDIERKIIEWITFILRRDDDSAVGGVANQIGPDVEWKIGKGKVMLTPKQVFEL